VRSFDGIVVHHTASPAGSGDAPCLRLVTHGSPPTRPAGPYCNVLLGRSGRCWLVAAGKANHAGVSAWPGPGRGSRASCNGFTLGIEAENDGVGEVWPRAQLDALVRLCNALLRGLALDADAVRAHKEVAAPLGRKIDPAGPWEGGGRWSEPGSRSIDAFRDLLRTTAFGRGARDMPQPSTITDIAESPLGGWYEVQADGGVFAQGCEFFGSLPGIDPPLPPRVMGVNHIVGMMVTPSGRGYLLAGRDGSVFAFGDAVFRGSDPTLGDVVGIVRSGAGYALIRDDHSRREFQQAPSRRVTNNRRRSTR